MSVRAVIVGLTVIALGVVFPMFLIHYMVVYGLVWYVALPLIVLSLIGAGILGVVGFTLIFEWGAPIRTPKSDRLLAEKLRIMRARQRALLEELDEIVELLREIRDILKSVEG